MADCWTNTKESEAYQAYHWADDRFCTQEYKRLDKENSAILGYAHFMPAHMHHTPRDCTDTLGPIMDQSTELRNGLIHHARTCDLEKLAAGRDAAILPSAPLCGHRADPCDPYLPKTARSLHQLSKRR